jgi:hypothetical protein
MADGNLYHPNDGVNDLYTSYDFSSSDVGPNPSSGYGIHRSVSDDILAAYREYNHVE